MVEGFENALLKATFGDTVPAGASATATSIKTAAARLRSLNAGVELVMQIALVVPEAHEAAARTAVAADTFATSMATAVVAEMETAVAAGSLGNSFTDWT